MKVNWLRMRSANAELAYLSNCQRTYAYQRQGYCYSYYSYYSYSNYPIRLTSPSSLDGVSTNLIQNAIGNQASQCGLKSGVVVDWGLKSGVVVGPESSTYRGA